MTALRILHLIAGRQWRGGEQQVVRLAGGLAARGACHQAVMTARDGPLHQRLDRHELTVHPVAWSMGLDPRTLLSLVRGMSGFTVIHAHDAHALRLIQWATTLTHKAPSIVATRRVMFPIRHPQLWNSVAKPIAVSAAVRHTMVAAGIAETDVTVIPPAIDLANASAPAAPSLHTLLELPRSTPLLVVAAAMTPEKGHRIAVIAADLMQKAGSPAHWAFLGGGPEQRPVAKMVRARGLASKVHLLGWRDDAPRLVGDATLMVVPSLSEGFGSVVLEGMGHGVPVLASETGGLPEALSEGGGVLVRPGDPGKLAEMALALLSNPAHLDALGQAGRKAVVRFDLQRVVDAHLGVYRSLFVSLPQANHVGVP